MYTVIMASDWLGKTLRFLRPGEELPLSPGITYSVAFQSDDEGMAVQAADAIKRRLIAEPGAGARARGGLAASRV